MMLRWEQLQPVNAAHIAWLKSSFRTADIRLAATRTLQRLLDTGSGSRRIAAEFGEDLFAFRHETLSGDWRGSLQSTVTGELNTPYASGQSPFRLSVFDVERQGQFVVLGYRHVLADARSIALLLHEMVQQTVEPNGSSPGFAATLGAKSLPELFPAAFRWTRIPAVAWNSTSELWKSLRCRKLPCLDPADLQMEFRFHQHSLPLGALKDLSRELGATFNDLLHAAVLEWLGREYPPEGSRRREFAAATLVDLNGRAPVPQPYAFGQYLSQFVVRAAVKSDMSFDAIVRLVARQATAGKEIAPLLLNVRSFEFLAREWDLLPAVRRPEYLPWALPVLAGVSNVNLRGVVGLEREALPIKNYFRGTCTTNLLPMMLSLTSVRDTVSLTTTHRPVFFSAKQMADLAAHVGRRLCDEAAGAEEPQISERRAA